MPLLLPLVAAAKVVVGTAAGDEAPAGVAAGKVMESASNFNE